MEWNAAYSRRSKGYINEVIEFGAVKCSADLKRKSTFSCFVKPQVGKHISALISNLTSITDETLTGGLTFMGAVSKFRKWAGDCLLLTWGTSDILALIENCRYFSGSGQVPFLNRYCDLQRYTQMQMNISMAVQMGLSRAAELLGLDFSGMEHHRALDDSLMALEIFRRVYSEKTLPAFTAVCDEDFYRRITFKTSYLCDLNDPQVQKSHLLFACPKCGGESRRTTHWVLKNKSFRAEFRCTGCGHAFDGRLTMKQKYEGLAVSKKTFPLPVIEAPRKAEPGVLGNLRLDIKDGVGLLRFPGLENSTTANAVFSTRLGGVSDKEFAAMNLGFGRGDEEENVARNYRLFCGAAGIDSESLVAGAQDHHVNIRRITAAHRGIGIWREKDMESIDGLCTDDRGVTLVIYCADCVPLYFVDEAHHAIGLAHAGWRGTVSGMARVMTERMAAEFGTRPEELYAAIGPSICRECFEVDEPVAAEFLWLPDAERFVTGPEEDGKYHVDLWECNRRFMLKAGILPEHITVGNVCTMCESDLLFSHRKTRGQRGSNCAMLSLR
ncbi:peptidoglycan editing factor PgeF [uncultured Neglectibacter sp.]|uniref:peptidoglycan editing factor PgeF n=1 Tax=uncultured Neglectibacter sp. TaxID=1924108 RepID=UPI0034DF3806